MSQITLPVSLGEALDKLTILEIKLLRISDSRREDCQKEHDVLLMQLKQYKDHFQHYYKLLLNINTTLWDIQDKFHGKDISPEEAAAIAKLILEDLWKVKITDLGRLRHSTKAKLAASPSVEHNQLPD